MAIYQGNTLVSNTAHAASADMAVKDIEGSVLTDSYHKHHTTSMTQLGFEANSSVTLPDFCTKVFETYPKNVILNFNSSREESASLINDDGTISLDICNGTLSFFTEENGSNLSIRLRWTPSDPPYNEYVIVSNKVGTSWTPSVFSKEMTNLEEDNVFLTDNFTHGKVWKGTKEEFDALGEWDDKTTYVITNEMNGFNDSHIGIYATLDDKVTSTESTWSSDKIYKSIVNTTINNDSVSKAVIDDDSVSKTYTWSSDKLNSNIDLKVFEASTSTMPKIVKEVVESSTDIAQVRSVYSEFETSEINNLNSNKLKANTIESGNMTVGTKDKPANLTITGDIISNGKIYNVHTEDVLSTNNTITLRDGASTALGETELTGILAKHYDAEGNDGQLAFDKNGIARVGDVGSTQAIATREDSPIDKGVAEWDSSTNKFVTKPESELLAGRATILETVRQFSTTDGEHSSETTSPFNGSQNVVIDLPDTINADIEGNVKGDLTGNVTGDVTGNVTGDLTGNVTGNLNGNLTGNVTGDLNGNVVGDLSGTATNATNATNDAKGHNIETTYATKTSLGHQVTFSISGHTLYITRYNHV